MSAAAGAGSAAQRGAAIALEEALPIGVAANVAACIAAGLVAALPGWAGQPLADKDGLSSASSSHLPIPILRCSSSQFTALLDRAQTRPDGSALVVFPRFARSIHTVEDYWVEHARRSLRLEELLGLGLAGPRTWIRRLTGSIPLLR
jgi:hypothetical protein